MRWMFQSQSGSLLIILEWSVLTNIPGPVVVSLDWRNVTVYIYYINVRSKWYIFIYILSSLRCLTVSLFTDHPWLTDWACPGAGTVQSAQLLTVLCTLQYRHLTHSLSLSVLYKQFYQSMEFTFYGFSVSICGHPVKWKWSWIKKTSGLNLVELKIF